jgi:hypothetical protein
MATGPGMMVMFVHVPGEQIPFGLLRITEQIAAAFFRTFDQDVAGLIHLLPFGSVVVEDFLIRQFLLIGEQGLNLLIAFMIQIAALLPGTAKLLLHICPDRVHLLVLIGRQIQLVGQP